MVRVVGWVNWTYYAIIRESLSPITAAADADAIAYATLRRVKSARLSICEFITFLKLTKKTTFL